MNKRDRLYASMDSIETSTNLIHKPDIQKSSSDIRILAKKASLPVISLTSPLLHQQLSGKQRVSSANLAKHFNSISMLNTRDDVKIPFKVVWKKSAHQSTNMPAVEKIQPITHFYQTKLRSENRKNLNAELDRCAQETYPEATGTSEILQLLKNECTAYLNYFKLENISHEKLESSSRIQNENLFDQLRLWQEIKSIFNSSLHDLENELLFDIERLEEESLYFNDFVKQHSAYTKNKTVEIQVNQIVKPIETQKVMLDKATLTIQRPATIAKKAKPKGQDNSESEILTTSHIHVDDLVDVVKPNVTEGQTQTDPFVVPVKTVEVVKEVVIYKDLMDKSSGTELVIYFSSSPLQCSNLPA